MKAVILAGGRGTRMFPLKKPKPLLKVAGKPVMQHTLEQLEGLVDEVVVVLHHEKTQIEEFLKSFPNQKITFAYQEFPAGTWDALQKARPFLEGRFIVLCGDDLYSREDIQVCLREKRAILVKQVNDNERFGIVSEENGFLKSISEKPSTPEGNLANTGMFVLDMEVFNQHVEKSPRGELELTDAVTSLKEVKVVRATSWIPIGYPWDLLEANEFLLKSIHPSNQGEVEEHAVLKGPVVVGKGTLIKSGAYIEGPAMIGEDCVIGPNCYIRPFTSIGNKCKVGNGVEIKNSILGDGTSVGHLSYFGDSVLGDSVNIGGGTIAANLRHDNHDIQVLVKGVKVSTRRRKFGCIVADGVHTGIHTSIYPGRLLEKDTLPREEVK